MPAKEENRERRWLWPMLASLLFSFTLCVFGPIEMYMGNAEEFWFGWKDFLPGTALAFAGVFSVLFGLCMALGGKGRKAACGLIFGLAVMLYAQGNFLNPGYGVMDGSPIDWSAYAGYAVWNTALWVVAPAGCLALALWKPKSFSAVSQFLCGALVAMQVISLGTILLTGQPKEAEASGELCFSKEGEFTLSAKENIVFFILDTVDTSTAEWMMEENPALFEPLDGFVMYPNAVCGYPVTKYALPFLLTGEHYLFEQSYGAYLTESWERERFFHGLHDRGYEVNLFTESAFVTPGMEGIVQNLAKVPPVAANQPALWLKLYQMVGFRYAPHVLKPALWFHTGELEQLRGVDDGTVYVPDDARFLRELRERGVSCTGEAPRFTMYHLEGEHVPFDLKADGTRAQKGETVTMMEQLCTVFGGVFRILNEMKDQGVYDGATIVITADHGNITRDHSPMLMIKGPGETGALRKNSVIAAQEDLHQTMATAAGIGLELPYGADLLRLDESVEREATHYNFRWADGDVFYEYAVERDDQGNAAYARTGQEYRPDGAYGVDTPVIALGERIQTGSIEALSPYVDEICTYFQQQAAGGVALNAPWQRFQWQLDENAEYSDLRVTFEVGEVYNPPQRVQVYIGAYLTEEATLDGGEKELSFVIPGDEIDGGLTAFTLRFPDARSEYETSGQPTDYQRRALSVAGFACEAEE